MKMTANSSFKTIFGNICRSYLYVSWVFVLYRVLRFHDLLGDKFFFGGFKITSNHYRSFLFNICLFTIFSPFVIWSFCSQLASLIRASNDSARSKAELRGDKFIFLSFISFSTVLISYVPGRSMKITSSVVCISMLAVGIWKRPLLVRSHSPKRPSIDQ